jgi:arsenite methyltransferase
MNKKEVKDQVKEYYGKTLSSGGNLQTNACCCDVDAIPLYQRKVLKLIAPEILDRYYGCGSPLPPQLTGCTILDLGCGTGRDAYSASMLAGQNGQVIAIDMTEEQLEVARRYLPEQMHKFGFESPNIEFIKGDIEDLQTSGIKDESVDVVISNCVINLAADKEKVFAEIFRVLKPGGELFFADVFSDRRVPEHISKDPVMYGECLGGTLYYHDFQRMLRNLGCNDVRIVVSHAITIGNEEIIAKAGDIKFHSATIRAFKLDNLEDDCENFGQEAVYHGTMPEQPDVFKLDSRNKFPANIRIPVCGNTALMLEQSRYAKHFTVFGDQSIHYGHFTTESMVASCC